MTGSRSKILQKGARMALLASTACAGVGGVQIGWAAEAPPQLAQVSGMRFDIPAQSLDTALTAFADQAGLKLVFSAPEIASIFSPGLRGAYTPADGLNALLVGSGYTWTFTDSRTVTLIRPAGGGAMVLDPVTVQGAAASGSQESAWGPVQGYAAKRSGTATKTDTDIKDIPQTINVVPRQVIEDQGATRLADVISNIPNAQTSGTSGNRSEGFILRGFTVKSYTIDGMSLNPALEATDVLRDFANIERVEVLKGPGSVLYGRSEPGGVVNLVTRRPSLDAGYDGELQYGSDDFYRAQAGATGAIDKEMGLAFRMDAAAQSDRGDRNYLRNSNREFLAPTLSWEPNDRTRVRTSVQYNTQIRPFDRGQVMVNGQVLDNNAYYGEKWSKSSGHKTDWDLRIEHDVNDWLTLRQNTHLDWGGLSRLSADPVRVNGDTLTRRASNQFDDTNNTDLQFEGLARFNTGPLGHQFLAGAEYVHARRDLIMWRAGLAGIDINNPTYGAAPGTYSLNATRGDKMDIQAAYFQDQVDIGEQWKVLAGWRVDQLDQTQERFTASAGSTYQVVRQDSQTGRLGLVYQPIKPLSLYVSYAESFQPQFASQASGAAPDPETGQQSEIGAKLDVTPSLSATLSAFKITKQNVATTDPSDSDYVILTGEQKARGVEFTVAGEVLPGWQVMASAGYVDAVISKDTTYKEGTRIAGVSPVTSSLWSVYEFQSGPLEGFGLGGGLNTVARRLGDQANTYQVGGYTRVDALAYYNLTDKVRVALNVHNLFDRDYVETPVSATENYMGAPLNAMLTLTARY